MGSRAIVDRVPRRGRGAASGSASSKAKTASATRGPAGASSRTRRSERELLATRSDAPSTAADSGSEFNTDWVCLDCELMPWSAKAHGAGAPAVRVGRDGRARRPGRDGSRARDALRPRGIDVGALLERHRGRGWTSRSGSHGRIGNYCWPVESLRDIRIAPFHVMATEGAVHVGQGSRLAHEHDRAASCRTTTAC